MESFSAVDCKLRLFGTAVCIKKNSFVDLSNQYLVYWSGWFGQSELFNQNTIWLHYFQVQFQVFIYKKALRFLRNYTVRLVFGKLYWLLGRVYFYYYYIKNEAKRFLRLGSKSMKLGLSVVDFLVVGETIRVKSNCKVLYLFLIIELSRFVR